MSSQTQQQQQQQQPAVVYPSSMSFQAPPSHRRSRSNGSFATVFIVVGVIFLASVISCFLGRFCNRRMSQTKPTSGTKRKQNRNLHPKDQGGDDIEFGPDGRVPVPGARPGGELHGEITSRRFDFRMPGNGDPKHGEPGGMPGINGDPREYRVSEHGETAEFSMPGNGYPGGEPAEFRMPGNGYPRIPETGDYVRFRMPEHGDPLGYRMAGHERDMSGETKHVADVGGALKTGA